MGTRAKKASKMQEQASSVKPLIKSGFFSRINFQNIPIPPLTDVYSWFASKRLIGKILLSITICVTCLCVFCYQPAKVFYTQVRETAKAQAELAAVQNRNSELSASVEELKTNEGIEDRATSEFGYVKDGEGAATVTGIEKKEANSVTPSINSDDISAPEVWYSPALDTIFGYSG